MVRDEKNTNNNHQNDRRQLGLELENHKEWISTTMRFEVRKIIK